jgi:hypothetical protein
MYLLIWQFSFFSETKKRVFIFSLLCNEIPFHLCQKEKEKEKKKGVNNNSYTTHRPRPTPHSPRLPPTNSSLVE